MSERQPHTLRISDRPGGLGWVVELDGQDIANSILGMTLRIEPGDRPTAVVRVAVEEAPTELDGVRVRVPDLTRDLLVRLGWTPPAEEATS